MKVERVSKFFYLGGGVVEADRARVRVGVFQAQPQD